MCDRQTLTSAMKFNILKEWAPLFPGHNFKIIEMQLKNIQKGKSILIESGELMVLKSVEEDNLHKMSTLQQMQMFEQQ